MIVDLDDLRVRLDSWKEREVDRLIERRATGKIKDGDAEFRERSALMSMYHKLLCVLVQARKDLQVLADIVLDRTGYRSDTSHRFITRSNFADTLASCGANQIASPISIDLNGSVVCPICDRRVTRRIYIVVYSRGGGQSDASS